MCDVQILTPPGRSAVATISLTGVQALGFLSAHFRRANGESVERLPLYAITFGNWGKGGKDLDQQSEGVVVARTKPNRVEVHCHGGSVAADRIIRDLTESGCHHVNENEASGSTNHVATTVVTVEEEASNALAQSLTERTAMILLDQYNGALRDVCQDTAKCIDDGHQEQALQKVRALLETYRTGRHLTQPWQVVLAGPANVGKSSLINALVGYQRSIVFNQPGTTRDVVTALTAIDGWPVELADTAGIRESHSADSEIEADGINRAQEHFRAADVAVLVLDATNVRETQNAPEVNKLEQLRSDAILVLNKVDLVDSRDGKPALLPNDRQAVITSATKPFGIDELLGAIGRVIESNDRDSRQQLIGNAMLFTDRQRQMIQSALLSLEALEAEQAKQYLHQI